MREYMCWLPSCGDRPVVQWSRRTEDGSSDVAPVFSCVSHAVNLDLAARVHQASCAEADPALLPGCSCAPEPLPGPVTPPLQDVITLPTGWTVPSP